MGTVRDLIRASLLDLGAIASSEAMTADEAADGLRALNLLLESWRLESLLIYAIDILSKVLTGATSYTWGTGGDIDSPRPIHLSRASLRLATSPTLDYPLQLLTDEEYEGIALKSQPSTIATAIYVDRAFPLANVFLWPVPTAGATLLLYPWHPLTSFAGLSTTVALPPGYERALQKHLALELSPQYRDCTISPTLANQAIDSKAWLKTANARPRYLTLPSALGVRRNRRGTDRAGFLTGWT